MRAQKCFEGTGPFVVWSVSAPAGRFHLVADATQRTFGVRVEASRTEDVKPNGAVVTLIRKYARTAGLGRILRDPATGNVWIPLFAGSGEAPTYWIQLAKTMPPELRFVTADGEALVRKTSQGTYTKRRKIDDPLPPYPPAAPFEDLTDALHQAAAALQKVEDPEAEPEPDAGLVLPEYQRDARDRLSRRVKTLRKSLEKLARQAGATPERSTLEREAALLAANLHAARPEAFELRVDDDGVERVLSLDPELTAGQNLAELYVRIKKAKRAVQAQGGQRERGEADFAAATADLARLREGPLPLAAVTAILKAHHLPLAKPETTPAGDQASLPWRIYEWQSAPDAKPVTILVGRSAAGGDDLCKQAKGNDYWLHAVSGTGSHVIIPARQVQGAAPAPALLKTAAILALHHSRHRGDHRGEVYFSRRQHIRKKKGMAPGLWQIDKAETLFYTYDEGELQLVLALARP